jgi:hypothetical protein
MAKFTVNYDVESTLQNQTWYKTRGRIFIKKKGGVNRDRIFSDERLGRTRDKKIFITIFIIGTIVLNLMVTKHTREDIRIELCDWISGNSNYMSIDLLKTLI